MGFFTSIVALRNASPYQPSTPAFSTHSRSIRTLTNKVIDKPFTSVLFSLVFPGSDHCLATSSPRNLCPRRLPRHPGLLAPPWSGPRPPRGASGGPGRGVDTCPACREFVGEFLGTLDSSSLVLTLNLQLSTFNRVSFLSPSSPHLCALCVLCGENSSSFRSSLIPRYSPLTTNSFIIRTSETPLPQLLYNPHLQTPLGSAGNKGLITPLESALTKNSPVTPVESALTKRWGVGVRGIPFRISDSSEVSRASAPGDAATGRSSPISFPCHTSEKSSANSNHCHTSKTAFRKSLACYTSKIPRGCYG